MLRTMFVKGDSSSRYDMYCSGTGTKCANILKSGIVDRIYTHLLDERDRC